MLPVFVAESKEVAVEQLAALCDRFEVPGMTYYRLLYGVGQMFVGLCELPGDERGREGGAVSCTP